MSKWDEFEPYEGEERATLPKWIERIIVPLFMLVALAIVGAIGWFIAVACGILMVSNVRYHSFKEVNFKGKASFKLLLLATLIFIIIAYEPLLVLFIFFFLYMLSGPILTVWSLQQKRRQKKRSKPL